MTTLRNAEYYLIKGRWPEYLAHHDIVFLDQLSSQSLQDYMTAHAEVLKPSTLVKFRGYARALAKFCAESRGFGFPTPAAGLDGSIASTG